MPTQCFHDMFARSSSSLAGTAWAWSRPALHGLAQPARGAHRLRDKHGDKHGERRWLRRDYRTAECDFFVGSQSRTKIRAAPAFTLVRHWRPAAGVLQGGPRGAPTL